MSSTMQCTLRNITIEDYPAVCKLMHEADQLHEKALPSRYEVGDTMRSEDWFRGILESKSRTICVAEVERQLIGLVEFALLKHDARLPIKERTFVTVDSLVVYTDYRQQGIGRMLMNHVNEWARQQHVTEIELNVFEFNEEAICFYEQLGYKTVSRRMQLVLR